MAFEQPLEHIVSLLKLDFASWFTVDASTRRAFTPGYRPDLQARAEALPSFVLIRRPRLVEDGMVRTWFATVDFISETERLCYDEAMMFVERLSPEGLREPKRTLRPEVTPLDEGDYYRVNVAFQFKQRRAS